MKRLSTIFIASLTLALTLLFIGCESQNGSNIMDSGESMQLNSASAGIDFSQPLASAIVLSKSVSVDGGAKFKLSSRDYNDAEFDIKGNNVSEDLTMTLTKLSTASNTYQLEPFGMDLTRGVDIMMGYDHSALPIGVAEENLSIYQLSENGYVDLGSRLQTNKKELYATAYSSGEFTLGAVDGDGNFHRIEGEFGLRAEGTINPKKGGIVRLTGGSYIEIPANALNERTEIAMIATRESISGKDGAKAFTFMPHGTIFNTPIRVVMSWKEFEGEDVRLLYFNETSGNWQNEGNAVWNESDNTVVLELTHFSRYAVAYGR